MKYSVEEPFRSILFVPSILYIIYKYGASRVHNVITVRGKILQTFRPKNAPILLDNKSGQVQLPWCSDHLS